MFFKGILAFLILVLPAAIIFGLIGALIRLRWEGHPKENWIVRGAMLVLSVAYVVGLWFIFG